MPELTHWQFKKSDDAQWAPAHTKGPITEIFPDLVRNGTIPDPFLDENEALVSFVGDSEWWYKSSIITDDELEARLVLHGLDTLCSVYFNDKHLIDTDNMFTRYSAPVTTLQGTNTLLLKFKPANNYPNKPYDPITLLPEYGTDRLFIRKAQYHYGWDWGPTLLTCGIFKPVELILQEKLTIVDVDYHLVGNDATLKVNVEDVSGEVRHTLKFKDVAIWEGSGHMIEQTVKDVKLWFPFTYGTPHCYTLVSELVVDSVVVDSVTQTIGFRTVELVQESLDKGSSFFFRVNDVEIYVNGCNWIPASPFLTTVTSEDYLSWLTIMKDGNQNMIRVWGGGIYEYDCFYTHCDELGILVWQDFMFACGQYPGDETFTKSVKLEAQQNVQRLKSHPSVVIYAGNNEDYQTRDDFSIPDDEFYAKMIYEEVLPSVITQIYGSGKIPYIPGSPYSAPDLRADDLTIGDVHQWNVWHGEELPYQQWYKLVGRFVSEFGMQAMPHYSTLSNCITNKDELFPQSSTVEYHNKAQGFEKKLALYLYQNVRILKNDLRSWIYATQLIQSECMQFAILAMRRQWRSVGDRRCGGQLVWQINDTYPVTSWALVDSSKVLKMGYFSVKRMSGECVVGSHRVDEGVEVFVCNSGGSFQGEVSVRLFDVRSSLVDSYTKVVDVSENSSVEVFTVEAASTKMIVALQLKSSSGGVISEHVDWPQPLKHYTLSAMPLDCYIVGDNAIEFKSSTLVKAVYIDCEGGTFTDNGFDLIPCQTKSVGFKGKRKRNGKGSVSMSMSMSGLIVLGTVMRP